MPEALRLPPIPAALAHIWDWFCELSASRTGNGGGANPIAFTEIEAWARLTGRLLTPRDVRAIGLLDGELFRIWSEQDRRREAARRAQSDRNRR